jgi:rubrerythrin
MIELDISTAVALYLLMTVISILLLWLFFDREAKPKQYTSEKKSIWQCEICAFSYVDSQHDVISKCPRCGSFNKRKENSL